MVLPRTQSVLGDMGRALSCVWLSDDMPAAVVTRLRRAASSELPESRDQQEQQAGHIEPKSKEPHSKDRRVLPQGNLEVIAIPVADSEKRDQRPDD